MVANKIDQYIAHETRSLVTVVIICVTVLCLLVWLSDHAAAIIGSAALLWFMYIMDSGKLPKTPRQKIWHWFIILSAVALVLLWVNGTILLPAKLIATLAIVLVAISFIISMKDDIHTFARAMGNNL